jgi:hypothetical protein
MTPHAAAAAPARERGQANEDSDGLYADVPAARTRKFILVEDNARNSRLRVRVTLGGVDTNEIPDSFRKGSSVYPRTYFPREMQSPPPSATGAQFFPDDLSDDGMEETEGREQIRRRAARSNGKIVKASTGDNQEVEVRVPRTTRAQRGREAQLNDLGYRMAWLQSRVFAGRTVFLQRALDSYRGKMRVAVEGSLQDVQTEAPHYETRIGKRRWASRTKHGERSDDE